MYKKLSCFDGGGHTLHSMDTPVCHICEHPTSHAIGYTLYRCRHHRDHCACVHDECNQTFLSRYQSRSRARECSFRCPHLNCKAIMGEAWISDIPPSKTVEVAAPRAKERPPRTASANDATPKARGTVTVLNSTFKQRGTPTPDVAVPKPRAQAPVLVLVPVPQDVAVPKPRAQAPVLAPVPNAWSLPLHQKFPLPIPVCEPQIVPVRTPPIPVPPYRPPFLVAMQSHVGPGAGVPPPSMVGWNPWAPTANRIFA